MSATSEDFFRKHGRRWKMITGEQAYKDAIDTIQATSPDLHILDKSPAEIKGVGDILMAKQQGIIATLNGLTTLADVPPEYTEQDEPPEGSRYPDPLEEFAEPRITKRRK